MKGDEIIKNQIDLFQIAHYSFVDATNPIFF